MEKLALYIKDCIKQQKTDNPTSSDEELFDVVLEDISSMVLDYTFWDYEMDLGVGGSVGLMIIWALTRPRHESKNAWLGRTFLFVTFEFSVTGERNYQELEEFLFLVKKFLCKRTIYWLIKEAI